METTFRLPFNSLHGQHDSLEVEMMKLVKEVYQSNWFILGERLQKFEKEFAAYSSVNHCVGVGNGLDALKISLKTIGIKKGDEILVPAHTYIATWLAVTELGATPIPIEPEQNGFNIDTLLLEEKITSNTKAILPVHLYGYPCKMDQLMAVANKHGLFVVEDNAQAVGAKYKNKMTGSFGHINATSFYPTKNLGAFGDAGAICTQDQTLAHKARLFRNYGSAVKYENDLEGYNSRLDELQAAVLSLKLGYLERWNKERLSLAQYYSTQLSGLEDILTPTYSSEVLPAVHLYVIRTKKREQLIQKLNNASIQTSIHYPIPPYAQKAYAHLGIDINRFPLANQLAKECLSLPLYPGLTNAEQDQVIEVINSR